MDNEEVMKEVNSVRSENEPKVASQSWSRKASLKRWGKKKSSAKVQQGHLMGDSQQE